MELTITMPHPPPACFPNRGHGRHWSAAYGAKKKQRRTASLLMLECMSKEGLRPGHVAPTDYCIRYYYKGTPHDEDNILAACKSILDGCEDALRINARLFRCAGIERVHALHDSRCGTVEITFTNQQNDNDMTPPPTPAAPAKKASRKRATFAYPWAAFALFFHPDCGWAVDTCLIKEAKESAIYSPLLQQRARARGAEKITTFTLRINELRDLAAPKPAFAPCLSHLGTSNYMKNGLRAALRALKPWLNIAGKNHQNLHYGTYVDEMKGVTL